jgi:hypothetical protein
VGQGPADGRPESALRVQGSLPPVPGQSEGAARGHRPQPAWTGAPPGPLVARLDMGKSPPVRASPNGEGRVRRFLRRYGWRAYAVPLLIVATLATLVDLAVNEPVVQSPMAGKATAALPPATRPLLKETPEPTAPAEGDVGPSLTPQVAGEETYVEQGAGSLSVVEGTSEVHGTGPLQRFVVETEDGIGVDGVAFAQAVEGTLADPRSWGNGGRMSFQRVGAAEASAGQYDFRVSLVSPGSMETYCPGVGTGGYTSCRYGERAVINLARWATAVPDYEGDVDTYRLYVVNHEVGHALGNRAHPLCPGPGQLAPVMQQQTLGLNGCAKNAWPYP